MYIFHIDKQFHWDAADSAAFLLILSILWNPYFPIPFLSNLLVLAVACDFPVQYNPSLGLCFIYFDALTFFFILTTFTMRANEFHVILSNVTCKHTYLFLLSVCNETH